MRLCAWTDRYPGDLHGVVLEGWARGETIGEASMGITEGMLGQMTAVGFAAGQCGRARAHLAWTKRYCGVRDSASVAHRRNISLVCRASSVASAGAKKSSVCVRAEATR